MDSEPSPRGLLHGVSDLRSAAFAAQPSKAKLCSKKTALSLSKNGPPSKSDLNNLVAEISKRIEANWANGGSQSRGKRNWRWELKTNLTAENPSEEVQLNRTLARALNASPNKDRWANEIPTSSGMAVIGGGELGGIDFAYNPSPGRVFLIELKVDGGSQNPVSAALQVVVYALLLHLARKTRDGIPPITMSKEWLEAKHADLRVLAPTAFYAEYPKLGWFEEGLNKAVEAFGKTYGFQLSFSFCRYDEKPNDESQLLAALNRKVEWKIAGT